VTMIDGADGYRLPTEAEWEFACRARTTTPYNVTTLLADGLSRSQASYDSSGPSEAGSYTPNATGLFDMHGNVWEWCWDWFDENYYSASPFALPTGPASGEHRVVRGGAWSSPQVSLLRSASREFVSQGQKHNDTGFRVVRSKYPDGIWP